MHKLTLALLLAASVVFTGCRSHARRYLTITNPAGEQILSLTRLGTHASTSSVHLRVTGKIDGDATLVLLQEKQPRQTLTLATGAVDTSWHGDWSGNQMTLHYLPGTVKSGGLQITCVFSD